MKYLTLFLTVLILYSCSSEKHPLSLSPLFSDHMVVQHDEPLVIWGTSVAGARISATGSWGAKAETGASDSAWMLKLDPPTAGGPYELTIATKDTSITITDVYSGEVWLASGQSNMEWPLSNTTDAEKEIASASFPQIRMFTVSRSLSLTETKTLSGSWVTCTPETAGAFSAAGYYFAKNLLQPLGVPVGIIHSSWGGTPAEAWTSTSTLRTLKDFDEQLDQVEAAAKEDQGLNAWFSRLKKVSLNDREVYDADLGDTQLSSQDYDDSSWKTMELPTLWEESVGNLDGIVWFRKGITLENEPKGSSTLSLGPIDDMDITYVNGQEIGRTVGSSTWQDTRVYTIPEGVLVKGKNVIAVKVIDEQGGGGIYGTPDALTLEADGTKVSLSGEWRFLPTAEYLNNNLYLLGFDNKNFSERPAALGLMSSHTPAALYNAMIVPIIDYSFKGAIWYQGESNVGRARQYLELFPAMIEDWRSAAGKEFPFYFAQIAPYQYSDGGTASADLREAQRRTLDKLEKTGMAVTLDIGNVSDIHPRNKKDVGERLARWALANDYGVDVVFSGPIYKSHEIEDNKLRVTFEYADSGLKFGSQGPAGFEIAGEDGKYYPATSAVPKGNTIVLSSPKVSRPVSARYAWSDVAEASLFSNDGLPASTFSTSW